MNNRLGSWTLALTLLAACSSTFVAAQSGRGGGYRHPGANRAAAYLRWLAEQLNLTDSQKASLQPILVQEGQQIRATRQDSSLSSDQKMSKVKEIHESFQPRITTILTPEQQEKYKQLEAEARERHRRTKTTAPNATPKKPTPPDNQADH